MLKTDIFAKILKHQHFIITKLSFLSESKIKMIIHQYTFPQIFAYTIFMVGAVQLIVILNYNCSFYTERLYNLEKEFPEFKFRKYIKKCIT